MSYRPANAATPGGRRRAPMADLDVLKALGDNTRYAIYTELLRASSPRTTAQVADALGLHPNTVRPHLERMRDVGLLEVDTGGRGGVGRPQHRYAVAPGAPSLGLDPSPWPLLAQVLLAAAAIGGVTADAVRQAGADQGEAAARRHRGRRADPISTLVGEQARLGFDPEVTTDDVTTTVAFGHCPFGELAESQPDLVCSLHCGMVEGFVAELGGHRVTGFHPLADRTPCRVELVGT